MMQSSSDARPALAADLMTALESAPFKTNLKPWGWELEWRLDHETLLKIIHVHHGAQTSLQRHEHKEEVIFVFDGDFGVYDAEGKRLAAMGQAVHITPGMIHRSIGDTTLLEVSTNFPEDVVRISDDYGRV